MKRNNLILIGSVVLILATTWVAVRAPRTVPLDQCSDLCRKYAEIEGINASYVKDFQVNDTVVVDVTLLQASDTRVWQYLLQAFHIPLELRGKSSGVTVHQSLRGHPEERYNSLADPSAEGVALDLVSISWSSQEISVFHSGDEQVNNELIRIKLLENKKKNLL